MATQRPRIVELLPMHEIYPQEMNRGVDPKDKIYLESEIEPMAVYLCDLWLTYRLLYAFQDNKLSEIAFQAGQLEAGIQNLEQMKRKLKLAYSKTVREITDNGLREIVTAMIACIEKEA